MEDDDDGIEIDTDDSTEDVMDVDSGPSMDRQQKEFEEWREQRRRVQLENAQEEKQAYIEALKIAKQQKTKLPNQRNFFFDRLSRESKFRYLLDPESYNSGPGDVESIVDLRLQLAKEMWDEYNQSYFNGNMEYIDLFNMTAWGRQVAKKRFENIQLYFFDLACQRFLQYTPIVVELSSPLWFMLYSHGIQYQWEALNLPTQSFRLDRRLADFVKDVLRDEAINFTKWAFAARKEQKVKEKRDQLWTPSDFQVLTFEEVETYVRNGRKIERVELFVEFVTPVDAVTLFNRILAHIQDISDYNGIRNPSKYAVVRKENVAEIRVSARRPALPEPPASPSAM